MIKFYVETLNGSCESTTHGEGFYSMTEAWNFAMNKEFTSFFITQKTEAGKIMSKIHYYNYNGVWDGELIEYNWAIVG